MTRRILSVVALLLAAGWSAAQPPSNPVSTRPAPPPPVPKTPPPVLPESPGRLDPTPAPRKPNPPPKASQVMPLELFGTIANPAKADAAPPNRLITNAKDWAGLQLAWGIKDPPKVDFTREMLVVATTNNDKLVIETDVDKAGDLHIRALDNGVETGGGFRYRIKAIDKAGIKTVEGVPLAKVLAAGPAAPVVPIPPPVLPPATVPRVPPPVVPPAVPPRVPPR